MIQKIDHDDAITVVIPDNERLTAANARDFKEQSIAVFEGGGGHMLFDFAQVSFVDSSGLGALVGILKRIGVRGDMSICGLNAEVDRMFRICRMDQVFSIYANRDAALRTIGEQL